MTTLPLNSFNFPEVNKITRVVNAVLALLIGYVLAQLVLDVLPRPNTGAAPLPNLPAAQKSSASTQSIAEQIANAHLFGRASAKPVKVVEQPVQQDAPETRLNLTLHGVLAYDPPENALAIISSGGASGNIFAIGDSIVGNTTLRAVHADRVIIRRSGKDETLRLPEKVAQLNIVNTAAQPAQTSNQNVGAVGALPGSAKELREQLIKQPSMMADLVAMRPYKRNGALIGFRIQPKRDPALLQSFGIQAGDVITSVNGIPLNSNRAGITALGQLRTATNVDLIVLRGGVETPVSVSLQ